MYARIDFALLFPETELVEVDPNILTSSGVNVIKQSTVVAFMTLQASDSN